MIRFQKVIQLDENGGYVLYLTTDGDVGGNSIYSLLPTVTIFRNQPCKSVDWSLSEDFKTFTIADNIDNADKSVEVVCEG